jgi:hypothetical protein
MSEKADQRKIKLFIGSTALIIGVVATGIALFRWTENATTVYLLGSYSKYVCVFGGILAAITGLLIIRDFWHQNSIEQRA